MNTIEETIHAVYRENTRVQMLLSEIELGFCDDYDVNVVEAHTSNLRAGKLINDLMNMNYNSVRL